MRAVRPRAFRCVRFAGRPVLPGMFPVRSSTAPPTIWYCSHPHRLATHLRPRIAPVIWKNQSGAIAVLTALGLTVLIGIVGLAVDVGMWHRANRAMQNAADAAAIAASQNGTASYQSEAKAVAAQYGFVDGSNGITVTALNNQTCPSPSTATDCYRVTVAQASAPLFFSAVLGLTAPAISSAAMVSSKETHSYCMLALNTTGTAITTNGSPSANLNGCSIMSNSGAKCDGTNLRTAPDGPTYGDAAGLRHQPKQQRAYGCRPLCLAAEQHSHESLWHCEDLVPAGA
jgi:Flp pilus assembly protein TadG